MRPHEFPHDLPLSDGAAVSDNAAQPDDGAIPLADSAEKDEDELTEE